MREDIKDIQGENRKLLNDLFGPEINKNYKDVLNGKPIDDLLYVRGELYDMISSKKERTVLYKLIGYIDDEITDRRDKKLKELGL